MVSATDQLCLCQGQRCRCIIYHRISVQIRRHSLIWQIILEYLLLSVEVVWIKLSGCQALRFNHSIVKINLILAIACNVITSLVSFFIILSLSLHSKLAQIDQVSFQSFLIFVKGRLRLLYGHCIHGIVRLYVFICLNSYSFHVSTNGLLLIVLRSWGVRCAADGDDCIWLIAWLLMGSG